MQLAQGHSESMRLGSHWDNLSQIIHVLRLLMGFPGWVSGEEPGWRQERQVRSLDREDPLEEETATHSSILAWRIPWTWELAVQGVAKSCI